jgi:uncharacterized protein YneF (UPF0154 family)
MRPPGVVRPARLIVTFWAAVIAVLLIVEVAELTHLFTLPLQSAVVNLVSFIFAIVFITILALVGSLFAGFYISQRLSSAQGFTPFEEEMLKMRVDLKALRDEVAEMRQAMLPPESPSPTRGGPK